MCEPSGCGPLPDVLEKEIVEKWLDARSIAMLDRAHCSRETRGQFLTLMHGSCLPDVSGKLRPVKAVYFVRWLKRLGMTTKHLIIPSMPNSELLSWMEHIGPSVVSIFYAVGLKDVLKYFPNLSQVDCSGLWLNDIGNPGTVDDILTDAAKSYNLRTVIAAGTALNNATVQAVAQHCRNLSHLDVSGCKHISNTSICAIATSCPLLQYLAISGTQVDGTAIAALGQHCSALTSLCAADIRVTEGACVPVGENCPELTYLSCTAMSDADLNAIVTGCTKLEKLTAWCTTATDWTLKTMLQNCPNLTLLNVSVSASISCEGFQVMGRSWPLRELRATRCSHLYDDGVQAVVASCPYLRDLNISFCEQLTDDAAHSIASCGGNLEYLNLEGCLEISVEGIRKIGKRCRKLKGVLVSLTKAEHRSVSGLYTRRGIGLEWEAIEMRPWEQRVQQAQEEERVMLMTLAAVFAAYAVVLAGRR